MLQYYLRMEPQLFHAAVDQQLQRLKEEKDAKEEAVRKSQEEDEQQQTPRSKSDLVLYQRMEEVRQNQPADTCSCTCFLLLWLWLLGVVAAVTSAANDSSQSSTVFNPALLPPLLTHVPQLRAMEVRATLEDLMYVSILEKFVVLGVEMLPRLDGEPWVPSIQQQWHLFMTLVVHRCWQVHIAHTGSPRYDGRDLRPGFGPCQLRSWVS
jgi:hypothetical protein